MLAVQGGRMSEAASIVLGAVVLVLLLLALVRVVFSAVDR
jgi:hypothetical protein